MPRGDKSAYNGKQKRQAEHIEQSYEEAGVSKEEAERRAWATVNKQDGGAKPGPKAKHPARSQTATKKAPARKTAARKTATKTTAAKKTTAKKAAAKTTAAKKTTARKTAATKSTRRKPAARKTAAAKSSAKKTARKTAKR